MIMTKNMPKWHYELRDTASCQNGNNCCNLHTCSNLATILKDSDMRIGMAHA